MHDGDKGFLLMCVDDEKRKNKIKICVYANECSVPHCHIIGLSQGEVCVRLDKPEYFYHETKVIKFNSIEKKLFGEFMHDKDEFGSINWSILATLWNRYADEDKTKLHIKIKEYPNYLDLE